MTAGGPASALLDAQRVVRTADEKRAAADLLEMAFQTQVGVAFGEQFGVDRAMRGMTGRAAFMHGLVLEYERPALGGMAAKATFILGQE